jgi:UDPglucose--hexose-1-phosphate uridylyltransferase
MTEKKTSGEIRKDPVSESWVIIAQERANRPLTTAINNRPQGQQFCPFCEGYESETLPEITALRTPGMKANGPGWSVRVVPNRYPALDTELALELYRSGIYCSIAARGAHEVIIEGAAHTRSVTELPSGMFTEVIKIYRERLASLSRLPHLRSGVLIKNVGLAAGASIEHSHSQLIATPIIPMRLQNELKTARAYYRKQRRCIWCDVLAEERRIHSRMVFEGDEIVAVCPYSPRFPFETWLMPKRHHSFFEATSDSCLVELATALHAVVWAIETILNNPPYNYVIHSAPFKSKNCSYYHWRIEILPRVTRAAGFEQATGLFINPTPPEHSAAQLREHLSGL